MAKIIQLKLEGKKCLDVSLLTTGTKQQLIGDLEAVGNDIDAVLMRSDYKTVKKVRL